MLKLDWATYESAKYACERWHYSGCMPQSKTVKIGVWEHGKFIGVIIYGLGATPNLCRPYGLELEEMGELVRIALDVHETPVSRMMAISFKFLRKHCPGIKLLASFADANQGHHGGIYQATNWVYTGTSAPAKFGFMNGKLIHPRTISDMVKRDPDIRNKLEWRLQSGKHRYLMPLHADMIPIVEKLRRPYPKRGTSIDGDAPGHQPGPTGFESHGVAPQSINPSEK